jgi:hypothetical protein
VHDEARHPVTKLPHYRGYRRTVSLPKQVDVPGEVHDRSANAARDEGENMVQFSR